MKQINRMFSKGSQSVEYKAVYSHNGNKVRLEIKKDSHDQQSYGKVYAWDKNSLKWNLIDSIPYANLRVVKDKVFHLREISDLTNKELAAFEEDKKILKQLAKDVLD